MTRDSILEQVATYDVQHVTVTGGEPLAQKAVQPLLTGLCDAGYHVTLETSGALPVDDVDQRVGIVMDIKTPSSGESEKNCYDNIALLNQKDEVKFVICNRADYEWACECMHTYNIVDSCDVLMSPAFAEQDPAELADWILQDKLPVRFQLQLHKLLWGDQPGH